MLDAAASGAREWLNIVSSGSFALSSGFSPAPRSAAEAMFVAAAAPRRRTRLRGGDDGSRVSPWQRSMASAFSTAVAVALARRVAVPGAVASAAASRRLPRRLPFCRRQGRRGDRGCRRLRRRGRSFWRSRRAGANARGPAADDDVDAAAGVAADAPPVRASAPSARAPSQRGALGSLIVLVRSAVGCAQEPRRNVHARRARRLRRARQSLRRQNAEQRRGGPIFTYEDPNITHRALVPHRRSRSLGDSTSTGPLRLARR